MATMASSSTSPTFPASSPPTKHNGTREPPPHSVYSTVMTPVNFVVFLFSLLLVDLRYSLARAKDHPDPTSRLPWWLHQLIYRRQPYQNVLHSAASQDEPGRWYYRTKQKKLMRMEASEAFQMRSTVLLVLATVAVAVVGVLYYVASRLCAAFLGPGWPPLAAPQAGPIE